MLKGNLDAAISKLISANGREEILDAAMEVKAWAKAVQEIERIPRECAEALKEEGDTLYG